MFNCHLCDSEVFTLSFMCVTFAEGPVLEWVKGLGSIVNLVSDLAVAVKPPLQVPALTPLSTDPRYPTLIDVYRQTETGLRSQNGVRSNMNTVTNEQISEEGCFHS